MLLLRGLLLLPFTRACFEILAMLTFGALRETIAKKKKHEKKNETSSSTCGQQRIMKCQEHNRSKKRTLRGKKSRSHVHGCSRKKKSKFAVRSVTELMVDDGQQADRGRKTRLNDVDGLGGGVKSAGRIERLLRNKRSFGELWNQKGECAIPCDRQLCSFPTLSEQESSQTRHMDRGEIEVEEERRVRIKRTPVLRQTERNMRTKACTWQSQPVQDRRFPQTFGEQVVVATSGHGAWIPCLRY